MSESYISGSGFTPISFSAEGIRTDTEVRYTLLQPDYGIKIPDFNANPAFADLLGSIGIKTFQYYLIPRHIAVFAPESFVSRLGSNGTLYAMDYDHGMFTDARTANVVIVDYIESIEEEVKETAVESKLDPSNALLWKTALESSIMINLARIAAENILIPSSGEVGRFFLNTLLQQI